MTTPTPTTVHDLIVIGSGPAGYTAAIYAARANLAPLVFEGSVTAGGSLMNTTEVENFPGFADGIMGPALMDEMRNQAARFGAHLITDDITAVDLTGPIKTVKDSDGEAWSAKTVILATGSAYKKLHLPDEDRLTGRGVSWCATCDGFFFRGKDVAVIGGGDSAVEEATFLTKFADKVYLVHRRDTLRASKAMQDRAFADPKIEFIWDSKVTGLHGQDTLEAISIGAAEPTDLVGSARMLAVSGLFIAIGHDPRSDLFHGQIDIDPDGYVTVAHPTTATNQPGVFACGDLVDHHYRQAITAAGTGCAAALDAERYLAALGH